MRPAKCGRSARCSPPAKGEPNRRGIPDLPLVRVCLPSSSVSASHEETQRHRILVLLNGCHPEAPAEPSDARAWAPEACGRGMYRASSPSRGDRGERERGLSRGRTFPRIHKAGGDSREARWPRTCPPVRRGRPWDVTQAIDAQGRLMRDLRRRFGSVAHALAAYNGVRRPSGAAAASRLTPRPAPTSPASSASSAGPSAPHSRRHALPAGRPSDIGPARHSIAGRRGPAPGRPALGHPPPRSGSRPGC
jgi:hypothetical protein